MCHGGASHPNGRNPATEKTLEAASVGRADLGRRGRSAAHPCRAHDARRTLLEPAVGLTLLVAHKSSSRRIWPLAGDLGQLQRQ
jgi:hypothetical protein